MFFSFSFISVIGSGLRDRGSILMRGKNAILFYFVKIPSEFQPASCPLGNWTLFPGLKRTDCLVPWE
jgi:hypothetical protein